MFIFAVSCYAALMTNNDILGRLRYSLHLHDTDMLKMLESGGHSTSREELASWFLKEDEEGWASCNNKAFLALLNGMIYTYRGKKDDAPPPEHEELDNNVILKKLRIALELKEEDLLLIMKLSGFELSRSELGAFFRKKGHKHYRDCKDQYLRNFFKGLTIYRNP
jgi:uncharacterized protein YehS (DUF1456 family)